MPFCIISAGLRRHWRSLTGYSQKSSGETVCFGLSSLCSLFYSYLSISWTSSATTMVIVETRLRRSQPSQAKRSFLDWMWGPRAPLQNEMIPGEAREFLYCILGTKCARILHLHWIFIVNEMDITWGKVGISCYWENMFLKTRVTFMILPWLYHSNLIIENSQVSWNLYLKY